MSGLADGPRALVAHIMLGDGCAGHDLSVVPAGTPTLAVLVAGPNALTRTTEPAAPRLRVALAGDLHARSDLVAALCVSLDTTDERLLALAWDRWGVQAPQRLHGEYAAVVHEPDERRVTLVRDHIGTHPLLWHFDGSCVCVATSIELLLRMLLQRPAVDLDTVVAHLHDPHYLGARTFLRGVQMVEPGRQVVLTPDGPTVTRWWDPVDVARAAPALGADHWAALDELVVRAVSDRLPAIGGVGVHLSGGVDSTLVAFVAKEQLMARGRTPQRAYTWSPPLSEIDPDTDRDAGTASPVGDERLRIAGLAGQLDVPLVWSARGTQHMREFLRRPIELSGASNVFDELAILERAQADGVRVLLSGWGGDEAISAHAPGVPAALLRAGRPLAAAKLVRRANRGTRPLRLLLRIAWHHALVPLMPDVLPRPRADLHRGHEDVAYLAPALRDRVDGPRVRLRATADPRADLARWISAGYLGERMATWSAWSEPHGIVHRYPLTDRRIMEHVLAAPPELLWADGRPRAPIRSVLRGRVRVVLSKGDPANERQRMRMLRGCWDLLGDEARAGTLDLTCDWLDVDALRADLLRGPSGDDLADGRAMLRMIPALRVLDLFQRTA